MGGLTLSHTLCNKHSNRVDTHMKESFCWCHTPRKSQDLYRCRSCVQHALGPAAGPTPYNGNTYTHFPLQLRVLSQRPHTAAQHPLLFVPRRSAPRPSQPPLSRGPTIRLPGKSERLFAKISVYREGLFNFIGRGLHRTSLGSCRGGLEKGCGCSARVYKRCRIFVRVVPGRGCLQANDV